jgi:DNA topoisomerase I
LVAHVAKRLGNTPAIAKNSYIDPRVIAAYVSKGEITKVKYAMINMRPRKYMNVDEQCVLRLITSK